MRKKVLNLAITTIFKIVVVLLVLFVARYIVTEEWYTRGLRPLLVSSTLIVFAEYLFKNKRKYYLSVIALVSMISSVLYIKKLTQEVVSFGIYNELVSFGIGCTNAVLILFLLLGSSSLAMATKILIVILLSLPIIFLWGYYFSSGAWVSVDTVMAVLQTNLSESSEYMSDYLGASDWISLAILLLVVIVIAVMASTLKRKSMLRCGSVILVGFILLNGYFAYRHRRNIVTDIAIQTKIYTEKYKDFEKKKLERKKALKNALVQVENENSGIYVLVIGESQNRNNMSAYGYDRETTPWLSSMKGVKNFIMLDKAYSCHTHTVPVLTYALTAKNQYNDLKLGESLSLLEVVEAAGFETVWVSNQVKYSAWDTPITVIADEANQQFWYNDNVGEKTSTNHYDLKLIDSVERIKLSNKMLIVFHLMGNHGAYRERYPKEFKKFEGRKTLDEYDNSILYNDYVVKNLFDKVKALPDFKGFIYFADHADAVLQGFAHDASNFVLEMTHVPMYMYFADSYIDEFADKVANLNEAKSETFTNDLIFNTVLSIMDVRVEKVYEASNDITSNDYDFDNKRFKTLYGKKQIVN